MDYNTRYKKNFEKIKLNLKNTEQDDASCKQKLAWLNKLSEFPFGRDLIFSRTISSYWIDQLTNKENYKKRKSNYKNSVEKMIEEQSFLIASWREIHRKFIDFTQNHLKEAYVIASIPCGHMRDLFELDFSKIRNYKLVGIDIDRKVVEEASILAKNYGLQAKVEFYCYDALNLPFSNEFDIVSSCGLNIYLQNSFQIHLLYKNFFISLKEHGMALIHFFKPPPFVSSTSSWKFERNEDKTTLFDSFLLQNILELPLSAYINETEMIKDMQHVGFEDIIINSDSFGVAGIAIAKKKSCL